MEVTAQQLLLQKIKDILPGYKSMAEELAGLLDLSVDSAYRRIRGETKLTLDEAALLCTHFGIPPESLLAPIGGSVNFLYRTIKTEADFQFYLRNILQSIGKIEGSKNGMLVYAGADIPVFHHFQYREHAAFKIFYWLNAVTQIEDFQFKKFSSTLIGEETLNIAKAAFDAYHRINTIEIWSEDSATSTVKQILYCWEAGLFERKEDALLVTEQLRDFLTNVQRQAEIQEGNTSRILYHSEIQIGNNCVLVKTPEPSMVYLRHQTINTMVTTNASFCQETDVFMKQLIKRSVLISGSATKQRHQFFSTIQASVEKLLSEIEKG